MLGYERLRPLVDRFGRWLTMEWRDVLHLDRLFERYGPYAVFIFRFMPVFRTMISLPAGLFRMGALSFIGWTFAGALIWNVLLVGGGWVLGSAVTEIDRYLGPVTTACVIIAIIAYVWRLIVWKPKGE
jgi:membrane protein DedA with SNARE-associated domain